MNYFIFDGESSLNYGVYIGGQNTFNAPQRDVAKVSIPGRNGDLIQDNGRFLNVQVPYNIVVMDSFRDKTDAIKAWLLSKKGYCKLVDTYHPGTYRMARVAGGIDFETAAYNLTGRTQVIFDCKPERFLDSGDEVFNVGEWGQTKSASGSMVTFEGNEGEAFAKTQATIIPTQDLHGYDYPWPPGGGKNLFEITANTSTFNGITATIDKSSGTVVLNGLVTSGKESAFFSLGQFELKAGVAYSMNGCPRGGGGGNFRLYVMGKSSPYYDDGNGVNFPVSEVDETITIRCIVYHDYEANNITFTPMIRLTSETDATFAPYSNICPINGRTGATFNIEGKNFFVNRVTQKVNKSFGEISPKDDGSYAVKITSAPSSTIICLFNTAMASGGTASNQNYGKKTIPNGQYRAFFSGDVPSNFRIQVLCSNDPSGTVDAVGVLDKNSGTFIIDDSFAYNWIRIVASKDLPAGYYILKPAILRQDEIDLTWTKYVGDSYPVSWQTEAGEVYGGTVDVVSGLLTMTMANIASYNGETIGEPWLSSMDRYAPGATPTIGAQVVYTLPSPQTYQLTAEQINTLLGENNVWADTGDVYVEWSLNPNIMLNPTRFPSKPKMRVKGQGSGTVTIEENTIVVSNLNEYVDIDSELMNCYKGAANKNADVALPNHEYPEFHPGVNSIEFGGGVTAVEVQGRWWTI